MNALRLLVAGPPSVTLRGVQHLLDDDRRFTVDGVLTLQGPRGTTTPVPPPASCSPALVVLVEPELERLAGTTDLLARLVGPEVPVLVLVRAVDHVLPEHLLGIAGCIASDCPPTALLSAVAAAGSGHRVFDRRISRVRRTDALDARHHAVLEQVRGGRTNREIAAALTMSEPAVKKTVTDLMVRLGVANRVQLAVLASATPA